MASGVIHVRDLAGEVHAVAAKAGESLMQAMALAGLQVSAVCGGCLACGTCHVYVDDDWLARLAPADPMEVELIAFGDHARLPNSRLSCQIRFQPEFDGLSLTLSPDTA